MSPNPRYLLRTTALALICGITATSASANPPLGNPSFEILGPNGSPVVHAPVAAGGAGHSAADSWGVFHNTVPATTTTAIVPTTLPGAGARMIHVQTDRQLNGINQVTGPPGSGAQQGIASAWVFVNSGVVGVGSGNHGNTGIDIETTVTGVWEYVQAPSGQAPSNQLLFYSVGGGADFYVEEADLLELQDRTDWVPLEYSNRFDENTIASGGGHAGNDAGQVLYTEPIDTAVDGYPQDAHDFFPGIEQFEPDAEVDALANGGDGGFQDLLADDAPLLVSLTGDPGSMEQIAVYREDIDGFMGVEFSQRDLHHDDAILAGELEDIDALEMWGDTGMPDQPGDADFYSLEFDVGASVWWDATSGPVVYLTPADIVGALNQLGFDGTPGDADVDALMVQDTGSPRGIWDHGDAVIFSIRPANAWDGGEIVLWEFGLAPQFLIHGGHQWNTGFDIAQGFGISSGEQDVDGLETIPVPEPGRVAMLTCGVSLLVVLHRRRRGDAA